MLEQPTNSHPILSYNDTAEVSRRVLTFSPESDTETELFDELCALWESFSTTLDAISRLRA